MTRFKNQQRIWTPDGEGVVASVIKDAVKITVWVWLDRDESERKEKGPTPFDEDECQEI